MKLALGLTLAAALLVSASASAAVDRGSDRPQLLLVGFKERPGAAARALVAQHGGKVVADFSEIGVLAVELDEARVGDLARAGAVDYVEQDEPRHPLGLAEAELTPAMSNGLYGLVTTRSVNAHDRGVTGAGVNVGVADTGLDYTHPDIAPNYSGGIDTVGAGDSDPFWNNAPDETHGTHVAGTVVAALNNQGVRGVAYNANLFHARVCTTTCTTTDIMEGVRWLVETAGVKVVNLSLGGPRKSRTEETFYKQMRSKGALVVAASGNDGSARKILYPAAYAVNISVGAVDRDNAHASFSNGGRGLDVSAPGVGVLSSVPLGQGSEASVTADQTFTAFGLEFAGTTAGVTGTLVDSGLCRVGDFPAATGGNIALCQRGEISFADKVTNAMNAGAVAAVIYNNVAGDFFGTLGTAGAWIPAVSVSDTTGAALVSQGGTTGTVVNQASDWDHYDGTSMATPHTTGVLALIWSVDPALSNTSVEDHLFNTCTDLGAAGYDTTFGRGLVNAEAAVISAGG
jgi:subtilisin family serine protease